MAGTAERLLKERKNHGVSAFFLRRSQPGGIYVKNSLVPNLPITFPSTSFYFLLLTQKPASVTAYNTSYIPTIIYSAATSRTSIHTQLVNTRNKRTQLFKTTKTWWTEKNKFHNTKFSFHMHSLLQKTGLSKKKKTGKKAAWRKFDLYARIAHRRWPGCARVWRTSRGDVIAKRNCLWQNFKSRKHDDDDDENAAWWTQ